MISILLALLLTSKTVPAPVLTEQARIELLVLKSQLSDWTMQVEYLHKQIEDKLRIYAELEKKLTPLGYHMNRETMLLEADNEVKK